MTINFPSSSDYRKTEVDLDHVLDNLRLQDKYNLDMWHLEGEVHKNLINVGFRTIRSLKYKVDGSDIDDSQFVGFCDSYMVLGINPQDHIEVFSGEESIQDEDHDKEFFEDEPISVVVLRRTATGNDQEELEHKLRVSEDTHLDIFVSPLFSVSEIEQVKQLPTDSDDWIVEGNDNDTNVFAIGDPKSKNRNFASLILQNIQKESKKFMSPGRLAVDLNKQMKARYGIHKHYNEMKRGQKSDLVNSLGLILRNAQESMNPWHYCAGTMSRFVERVLTDHGYEEFRHFDYKNQDGFVTCNTYFKKDDQLFLISRTDCLSRVHSKEGYYDDHQGRNISFDYTNNQHLVAMLHNVKTPSEGIAKDAYVRDMERCKQFMKDKYNPMVGHALVQAISR